MNKTSTPNQLFYPQCNSKLIKVFATVFLLFMCSFGFSQTSTLYDFNTTGQLTGVFNSSGPGVANVVESVTGGIDNSGSITVPETSTDAIFATKDGYSLGPVGSTYRFESFIKSVYNSGYSGLGFTPASPAVGSSVTAYRPDNSLGISVHGGGFIFHNGATNYDGSWNGGSSGSITAVKSASIFDLLNSGSPDSWYRIIFVITRSSSTEYDLRVEVWPANDDGTLIRPAEADAIFEVNGVTNSAITAAPVIYSYFSFSGQRVSHFDNYRIELSGGATVVTAGAPVVLTTSSSLVGDVVTIDGNVTSDNGSLVTDRGFVYSTSSNPTITDTKVSIASGTGIFSGSTPSLSTGTYYFRTFATNSEGTSYGSEEEVVILAIPIGSIIITSDPSDPGTDWDLTSGLLIPLVDGAKVNVSEVTAALATGDLIIEAATDVFIDTNIAPALAAARSLTLKANRNVQIEPSASIAPTGNALNTVVWSDADGDDDGMIWLNWDATDGGTAINTNGGHFWMGGGSGSTTWNGLTVGNGVARGNAQNSNGITIISSTIETGGGNLAFYGRGRTGATVAITTPIGSSNNNNGIRMHGGNSIDTGTGTIYMYGYADESGALSNSNGIELSQAGGTDLITNSNTTVDAILLEGYAENNATASNAWGVYTHNSVIQNTSSGTIHLKGGAAKDSGVTVAADGAVLSSSGNIILEGTGAGGTNPEVLIQGAVGQKAGSAITSSSADIEIIGDRFSISGAAPNGLIASSGKLTIRPRTASTTLGIAGGTGTLELPASYFSANFVDGFSSIIIGSEDVGQVNIGTSALSYDDPLTIKTGSSIYFDAAANVSGNNNAITLWTRAGGNNGGSDNVPGATWMPEGSNLNTGGGNVIIGGGSDPTIGYAVGDNVGPSGENNARYRGVTINGTLAAGGGNISILGKGGNVGISNARGVSVGGDISTTGTGTITITGIAHTSSDGFALGDGSITGPDGTISAVDGAVTINGYRATGDAINISTAASAITSEGTITLEAKNDGRLTIDGEISGLGGVSSGNIILITDDLNLTGSSQLSSQGTLTIQTRTPTTTIGLNAASGTLSLSSDNLSTNILDGFEEIIIGGASQQGNIYANTFTIRDNFRFNSTGNLILEGDLALNGQTVTLGEDITLDESAGRFFGSTGELTTTRTLGSLTAENVGGMGATITTSTNLGSTTITRTHGSQTKGTANSILRSYDIVPTTNTGLDATLVFNYVDGELNSLNESSLSLHRSTDGGTNWTNEGGTVNESGNTASLTGIDAFSLWALFTGEFIWSANMSTEDGATDGNWEGGLAPPTGSDIVIPEGATPYPVFDFDFEAGDITIGNNATFTMAPGFTLTFAAGKGATGDGKIILKSDGTGDASIGDLTGAGSIDIVVQQERFLAGGNRAFRFFSHPYTTAVPLSVVATAIDITGVGGSANGFTTTATNAPSAFRFDPLNADGNEDNDGGWEAFTSISQTIGQHEAIRILFRGSKGQASSLLDDGSYTPDPVTIEWEGTINQGTQNIALVGVASGLEFSDWNLVGNPFPSAIDLSAAGVSHSSGVVDYAVWRPRQSYTGDFSLIAGSGRGGAYLQEPFDTSPTNAKIPSGGGFFIRAGGTSGTLTIPEPAKTSVTPADISNILRMEDVPSRYGQNTLQIALEAENDFVDRVLVFLGNEYNPTRELQDAPKMANPLVNFFTVSEDDWALAIDRRTYTEQEGENRIPLHILAPNFKYTLSLPDFDIEEGRTIQLYDRFTEEYVTLAKGTTYDFEVTDDPSTKGHRFDIVMGIEVITSIHPSNHRFQAYLLPNPAQEQVRISIQKPDNVAETTVKIVSMAGVEVRSEKLTTETVELDINLSQLSKGIYLVEITHGTERIVKRLIVN